MTSDSGLTSQDTDYARHIQEVLHELRQMQQTPRLVTSPDDLEALEREIRQRTDRLDLLYASLLPPVAPRNFLLYQLLPTSIQHRHANARRRKDDTGVGTATRGIVA